MAQEKNLKSFSEKYPLKQPLKSPYSEGHQNTALRKAEVTG